MVECVQVFAPAPQIKTLRYSKAFTTSWRVLISRGSSGQPPPLSATVAACRLWSREPHFHHTTAAMMAARMRSSKRTGTCMLPTLNDPMLSSEDEPRVRDESRDHELSKSRSRRVPKSRSSPRPRSQPKSNFGHSHLESPPLNQSPSFSPFPVS